MVCFKVYVDTFPDWSMQSFHCLPTNQISIFCINIEVMVMDNCCINIFMVLNIVNFISTPKILIYRNKMSWNVLIHCLPTNQVSTICIWCMSMQIMVTDHNNLNNKRFNYAMLDTRGWVSMNGYFASIYFFTISYNDEMGAGGSFVPMFSEDDLPFLTSGNYELIRFCNVWCCW